MIFTRIVDAANATQKPTTSTQRCSAAQRTFSNLLISSSRSVSVGRATPSSQRAQLNLPSVPLVNECTLDHSAIGDSRFGSCSQMAYKDLYIVCVKRMEKDRVS